MIEQWRIYSTTRRPHDALGNQPPTPQTNLPRAMPTMPKNRFNKRLHKNHVGIGGDVKATSNVTVAKSGYAQ